MRAKYYPRGGPKIVREELERLGLQWMPPTTPLNKVDAIWVMRLESDEVKALGPGQKANWIPGMPEMCWKHLLHSNITSAKLRFGEAPFSFWPNGWNLPEEYDALREFYEKRRQEAAGGDPSFPVILKPSLQACGNGIRCITDIDQLSRDDPFLEIKSVAQHYIPNPVLLDGFKVTFRIYVLVSSVSPLRAYIYPNGLGRICSHRFTTDLASFSDLFAHLTNYDINKHNLGDFLETSQNGEKMAENGVSTDGLRTDFLTVLQYLKRQGYDTDLLWERMKRVTGLTLLATNPKISSVATSQTKYRNTTFEILGFDFLVDDQMEPWILEVNHGPNLEPHTVLETELKRGMIRDALQLVDISHSHRQTLQTLSERTTQLIDQLNAKGLSIDQKLEFQNSQGQACHFPFGSLNRPEAMALAELELETENRGQWQSVFPTLDADSIFTLNDIQSESSATIYKEGFAGRRNDLAVSFLQLNRPLQEIHELAQQMLDSGPSA